MQESGGGDRRRCERSNCVCPGGVVEGDKGLGMGGTQVSRFMGERRIERVRKTNMID